MENSTSFKLAKIISNLTCPVMFNGQFKRDADPYHQVDKVLFGHRIANIVVAGAEMRLIFKIHYTPELGKKFLQNFSGNNNPTQAMIDDFFLESCNLAAGRVKHGFEDEKTNLGLSIPIKTKAFDDMFFSLRTDREFSTEWHWDLSLDDLKIHLSVFIELLNQDLVVNEKLDDVQQVDELEFF